MINRKLPPPSFKGEKDFGTYRATYIDPKLFRAFICMIDGINNPSCDCISGPHGGQSCPETRQNVREVLDHPEMRRMRLAGLGYCLPWGLFRETPNSVVLVDFNRVPILRLSDSLQPRIVCPSETNYWTWGGSFFPTDVSPEHKDAFAAGFLLANSYGLWNEILWRNFLSDFGTKDVSEWVGKWRTYGRRTHYNYMHGT